jgi:hypothetical protein
MLVAAILGFLLRRFRNWRLTWQIAVNVSPTTQFQLADVLLWTTLIAAGLAAIRFLVTLDEDFSDQFLGIAVIVARSLGTVLTVLVASFAVRQYLRTGIATLVVLLLLGSMLSVTDIYTTFRQVSTGWTIPLSMSQYLILAAKEVLDAGGFVAAAAIQTLLNSLVLRALGCRLVRPLHRPAVPAGELRPA